MKISILTITLSLTLICAKALPIRFNKINGFIGVYDGTEYLVLFGTEKYDAIFNRISYLIGVKSGITYVISHCYVKIKVDSYDSLPLKKKLTFHNDVMLIKSIFNKDKYNYYHNAFWGKGLLQLSKNNNNK